jgi:arabinogalactan endo-1,4-beta-galactosidase
MGILLDFHMSDTWASVGEQHVPSAWAGMSPTDMQTNWANFSGLVNASIKAVRETDPKIIVIAQHGRPRPDGNFEPWLDKYLAGSPPIDEDGVCGSTYGTTK